MARPKYFNALCRSLAGHTRADETLNRLFRKNVGDPLPFLTHENTEITYEEMSRAKLKEMAGEGPSFASEGLITVLRFRGRESVLDGNKRCRECAGRDPREMVTVRVLTVVE